eukprot:GHVT01049724.1.p1 GENE.GHVT01049724.1~~GHVT01049724.1.p1  ORF type:complete len:539 (-),score=59.10 GHVT01049724.1:420-2036(-)
MVLLLRATLSPLKWIKNSKPPAIVFTGVPPSPPPPRYPCDLQMHVRGLRNHCDCCSLGLMLKGKMKLLVKQTSTPSVGIFIDNAWRNIANANRATLSASSFSSSAPASSLEMTTRRAQRATHREMTLPGVYVPLEASLLKNHFPFAKVLPVSASPRTFTRAKGCVAVTSFCAPLQPPNPPTTSTTRGRFNGRSSNNNNNNNNNDEKKKSNSNNSSSSRSVMNSMSSSVSSIFSISVSMSKLNSSFAGFPLRVSLRHFSLYLDSGGVLASRLPSASSSALDILQLYKDERVLDTPTLEQVLRSVGRAVASLPRRARLDLMRGEGFERLTTDIAGRLEDADSRLLALFGNALALFKPQTPAVLHVVGRLSEVVQRRANGFSPRQLSTLSLAFSVFGLRDPQLVQFLREETMRQLPHFSPPDVYITLEAMRRTKDYKKELVDLLVEKLCDDVDRFTLRDTVECLNVLAKMGLARGFLLRRLMSLGMSSLSVLSARQLLMLLQSAARLRFSTSRDVEDIVAALRGQLSTFTRVQAAQINFLF